MAASTSRWQILPYWKSLVVMLVPLLLLPLPLVCKTAEARCGYVIIIMAVFWMTDALPLAVTALIPLVGFPLLGVMSTAELCLVYMEETNMMFLGGLTMAISVEHSNLHRRIALFVLLHVGQSPRRLMAGFMFTTMFLSMWISNTAATAMMVPIVDAILVELYSKKEDGLRPEPVTPRADEETESNTKIKSESFLPNGSTAPISNGHATDLKPSGKTPHEESDGLNLTDIGNGMGSFICRADEETESNTKIKSDSFLPNGSTAPISNGHATVLKPSGKTPHEESDGLNLTDIGNGMRKALLLAVAYSANIGGTGVVTGTPPNLIVMATLQDAFDEPTGLNFATWMGYNIPGMLICVTIAFFWLQFYFMRSKGGIGSSTKEQRENVKRTLSVRYKELGPVTLHESVVMTLFVCVVLMWFFRSPEFIPGWASWFVTAFGSMIEVADTTPVMLIIIVLFAIPKEINFWCFRDPNDTSPVKSVEGCLNWDVIQRKVPWGIVLLLGGGFAIAEASDASGLSVWLGDQLSALKVLPVGVVVLIVTLMTAMVTEVASNTATASILMPVLKEMSIAIEVNPIYLMLPAAVCCSYAFMLPVATPPNAIVFGASNMRTIDMMKAGLFMNVACILVENIMINSLGILMFDVRNFPSWANSTSTV